MEPNEAWEAVRENHLFLPSEEDQPSLGEEVGLSGRYGGIHFARGDLMGRKSGKLVADGAWEKAQSYFSGSNSSPTALKSRCALSLPLDGAEELDETLPLTAILFGQHLHSHFAVSG